MHSKDDKDNTIMEENFRWSKLHKYCIQASQQSIWNYQDSCFWYYHALNVLMNDAASRIPSQTGILS
jgi:hypothetical protein